MTIYFKKKYFGNDNTKPDGVVGWQFTKENYSSGTPSFIRRYFVGGSKANIAVINLWSQYGGNVIAGELNINGVVIPVYEGDYIVKLETDEPIDVVSRSEFEQYYRPFAYVNKWHRFLNWIFNK
ncbi:hypothetical protein G9406_06695 [Weissella paramesenteroides]|uniref:hypothetical protein n=1 Tax=Weissella paramesenteroides TaxID=1249 RepID=UPI0024028C60|nr:hypothetical protein [Weissella paramesenteroides]MDF8367264.1 hypothetical protein [Weissella paramesenteroides]